MSTDRIPDQQLDLDAHSRWQHARTEIAKVSRQLLAASGGSVQGLIAELHALHRAEALAATDLAAMLAARGHK